MITSATTTPPTRIISSDDELRDTINELAVKQLLIKGAANEVAKKLEAAKQAFAEITDPIMVEITADEAAVAAYCKTHRDRLYPSKNGKQAKSITVLEHKLQFRSTPSTEAPEDAVAQISQKLAELALQSRSIDPRGLTLIEHQIDLLNSLLRQPPIELDKDAAATALADEHDAAFLSQIGIKKVTTETFKIAYTLKPEPKKPAAPTPSE